MKTPWYIIFIKSKFIQYLKKLSNIKIFLPIPIPAIGCGIIGLSFAKQEIDIGKIASNLLKSLEYRGHDSTGAIIQDKDKNIILRKDIGTPSEIIPTLGIEDLEGKLFCGQVRWATFGAVTRNNAQPHLVNCKTSIYGAHTGNITNTNKLKEYLIREGHNITGDNDGEMIVHIIEHFFYTNLHTYNSEQRNEINIRKKAMRKAILEGKNYLEGSYAAMIVDPVSENIWALKSGNTLYAGVGKYKKNNFILTSSDLTAILQYTKDLITINDNEFIEFNHKEFQVYSLQDHKVTSKNQEPIFYKTGEAITAKIKRSKLRVEDVTLDPQFDFYMQQEIYASINTTHKLVGFLTGGTEINKQIAEELWRHRAMEKMQKIGLKIIDEQNFEKRLNEFKEFYQSKECAKIKEYLHKKNENLKVLLFRKNFILNEFNSKHAPLFLDLYEECLAEKNKYEILLAAKVLDTASEQREIEKFKNYMSKFITTLVRTWESHGNIYTISAGSSYNACKTAALFFNEIAKIEIIPILPGNFIGQYSNTIRNKDIIIGVSQSGETKDLLDVFNALEQQDLKIDKIAIVNNENSTLAHDKTDYYLPIKCGPEIAVPATKSFINQIVLFYFLAIEAAKYKAKHLRKKEGPTAIQKEIYNSAKKRKKNILELPKLLEETINQTEQPLNKIADELFLEPSIHILSNKISPIAKEGALKIRETVLNHTQGIEGAEFKHGSNTLLGVNTILGLNDIEKILQIQSELFVNIYDMGRQSSIRRDELKRLMETTSGYLFHRNQPFNLSAASEKIFNNVVKNYNLGEFLDSGYPLIYLTGPSEKDVNLTISQINTNKIRGANSYVIAEENNSLRKSTTTAPEENKNYKWNYIILPKTGDTILSAFSGIITLQLLSLKMCIKKMNYLNKIKIPMHGVHPDVPKNVSKFITVD